MNTNKVQDMEKTVQETNVLSLFTSALWNITNSSHTYSFKKDPLPVFQILVDYYKSIHNFNTEIPENWIDTLDELETITHKCINTTSNKLFEKFKDALHEYVGSDEELLANVVDFFVYKYGENNLNDGGELILSDILIDFIYWYAVGVEACTSGLALYNPFANIASFGVKHINHINIQRKDSGEEYDEKSSYVETPWFNGVESNVTNRLIASVRLFINNPSNLRQMYITADDSLEDEIEGYSGEWTYLVTPPIASNDISSDALIELIIKSIEKFLDPKSKGMADAFFILPRDFCSNPNYERIRRKIVSAGMLCSVLDLPRSLFKLEFEGVLIHLYKNTAYGGKTARDVGYTRFFFAGNYTGGSINELFCDYNFNGCFCSEEEVDSITNNTYLKNIDTATIINHGCCLLPELYIPTPIEKKPNEVSIYLKEFIAHTPSPLNPQDSGLCISSSSFKKNTDALFELPVFEEIEPGTYARKYEGKHLVIMYNGEEFLLCKTQEDSTFCLTGNQVAFKLRDDSPISLDYVINGILRSKYLERLSSSVKSVYGDSWYISHNVPFNVLNSEILVELDITDRTKTMSNLKLQYDKRKEEEEAKRIREAQREATSDIAHMLGTSFSNIGTSLYLLKDKEGSREIYEKLKGNFDHIKRVLQNIGKDFSTPTIKKSVLVNKFFEYYISSQKHYGKKTFSLDFTTDVSNESSFNIDETFMFILLDTLLDNAYRHGFERVKSDEHKVLISISNVSIKNENFILLKVANNGTGMPEGFTISDYISRGVTFGESGRTGLGGCHVYDITKQHNGFLYITNDEDWNFIVEILIPSNDKDISYTEYENSEKCI